MEIMDINTDQQLENLQKNISAEQVVTRSVAYRNTKLSTLQPSGNGAKADKEN